MNPSPNPSLNPNPNHNHNHNHNQARSAPPSASEPPGGDTQASPSPAGLPAATRLPDADRPTNTWTRVDGSTVVRV